MAPTPRRRAANGRFAADAPADLGAIRADYEAGVLSITDLCIRHSISASAVHRLVVTHGWKPRAPHRIDPGDLIMRMFALLDAQLRDLETTMREAGSADAAMLGKLVTTLDRLIVIKRAEMSRGAHTASKEITALRAQIAERIAELNA